MEARITIANPFPVLISWNVNNDDSMREWIRENIQGHHEVFYLGRDSLKMMVSKEDVVYCGVDQHLLLMFEDVRDAMLFKITWSGM